MPRRPLDWEPRQYILLRVSPHGNRIAYAAGPGHHFSIHVRDLATNVPTPLNTGGYDNEVGAWSPDGTSLLISSDREPPQTVYRIAADNSGAPVPVAPSPRGQQAESWSSQGVIAYEQGGDIWTVAPGGKPMPFVATSAYEGSADFSPDGHWLAYVSDASGRPEVYVRPYPGPGASIPVSGDGGQGPTWSPDGRHLYYIQGRMNNKPVMMVADVLARAPFRVGRARPLIDPWPYETAAPERSYDVLPDGSFIASRLLAPAGIVGGTRAIMRATHRVGEIHVILNFAAGLGGKTP